MNEVTEHLEQFGVNPWVLFSQVAALVFGVTVFIALPLVVTRSCLRPFRGDARLALWLVIVWLIPIFGPLFGLAAARAFLAPRAGESGR